MDYEKLISLKENKINILVVHFGMGEENDYLVVTDYLR
jgi:hypothetical protein